MDNETTKKPNRKPTLRQRRALDKLVENGGNVSKAMRDAGYSEAMSKHPEKFTGSNGFKLLAEKYLPDDLLMKVHKEGLEAGKPIYKDNEEVGFEADYPTRHKYLETAYKIKDKMPKSNPMTAVQINFGEERDKYV